MRRTLPRRSFLGALGASAAAGLLVPGCGTLTTERAGALLSSRLPLPERFAIPLPIPDAIEPAGGAIELVQQAASVEIIPGTHTEVWGYNGTFPGPILELRSGRPTTVRVTNELPVPTSTHLHGGVTPPEFDGYPTHLVVPAQLGQRFEPGAGSHASHDASVWKLTTGAFEHEYPVDQPAGTLWYHDHRMDFTGPQVYRGLAGFAIVRDDVDDALPLPKGEKDVPLLICDRAFEEDGSFRYPAVDPALLDEPGVEGEYHQGVEGDVILVNGAPWPELEVEAARYRFRILNASNARRFDLRLDPPPPSGPAFVQVGSDVGLLTSPQDLDGVLLASAERADVLIDFGTYPVGAEVVLRNRLDDGPAGDVMRFRVARTGSENSEVPARLADVEVLSRAQAVRRRTFHFQRVGAMWQVNNAEFDPGETLATPELGTTELWTFTSDFHHPVHVHLAHFQVYRRNGKPPAPMDAGWKDTVDIRPYEVVEVLVKFDGFRGRYVMHCHNLEHEDMAMMANFDIV